MLTPPAGIPFTATDTLPERGLAMARSVGVELTIDDFQAVSDRVPYLADLKPSGKFVQEELHEVGGTPAVMMMRSPGWAKPSR